MDTITIVLSLLVVLILALLVLLVISAAKCKKQYDSLRKGYADLLAYCKQASEYHQELISENNNLREDNERVSSEADALDKELRGTMLKFFNDQLSEYEDLKVNCQELISIRSESVRSQFDGVPQEEITPEYVKCLLDTNLMFVQKGVSYELEKSEEALKRRLSDQFPLNNVGYASASSVGGNVQSNDIAF